jgi:hypothetical protein
MPVLLLHLDVGGATARHGNPAREAADSARNA